jgi:hypothetical protein
MLATIQELKAALESAQSHLNYCGWGDLWEREGAEASKLPEKIESALERSRQFFPDPPPPLMSNGVSVDDYEEFGRPTPCPHCSKVFCGTRGVANHKKNSSKCKSKFPRTIQP